MLANTNVETDNMNIGIMDGIMAPPSIALPGLSFSAPESRRATPPRAPRRHAISQPVSPRKPGHKPLTGQKPLSPIAKSLLSPTRAIKKHNYCATFSSYNPRAVKKLAPCPVHSYSSIEQEIKALPGHSSGGVKFSDAPREQPRISSCPVHVYQEAKSQLSTLGSASFAKYAPKEAPAGCPVHSYVAQPSSLRSHAASFAKAATPRTELSSGPPVHAYAPLSSTLSARGATAFSMERLDGGRDAYMRTDRALAPVHAYANPTSSFRSVGAATFGSSPSLRGSSSTPTLTRTGLLVYPASKPRALKPLPKLVPLAEEAHAKAVAMEAPKGLAVTPPPKDLDDAAGSPREIESLLLEAPASP